MILVALVSLIVGLGIGWAFPLSAPKPDTPIWPDKQDFPPVFE